LVKRSISLTRLVAFALGLLLLGAVTACGETAAPTATPVPTTAPTATVPSLSVPPAVGTSAPAALTPGAAGPVATGAAPLPQSTSVPGLTPAP
jgi:hypothetical protein